MLCLTSPLALTLALSAASPAAAQIAETRSEEERVFSAPAGRLDALLVAIAEAFDANIIASDDLVAGKMGAEVTGATSAETALDQALAGAGLEARRNRRGSFVLSASASDGNGRRSGAIDEPADEIIVVGVTPDGFGVGENSTATPLTSNPLDVPFATVALPQQLLDEVGALRLQDAYDYASGVNPEGGYGGIATGDFFARGFSGGDALRNGYRDFGFITAFDISYIERVEIVKGPASILYGAQASPGLQVNYVTKSPTVERFAEAEIFVGSFENTRVTLDTGGRLTDDDELLFRLNAAYEDSESHVDFVENDGFSIAPVLQWNLSPRTTLKLEGTYQDFSFTFDRSFLPEEPFFDLPVSRFLGEPGLSNAEGESYSIFGDLKHQFNDSLSYHFGASFIRSDLDTQFMQPRVLDADTGVLTRQFNDGVDFTENLAIRNEVFWNTAFGNIENSLVVGVEYADYEFFFEYFQGPVEAPINIFDPQYGYRPDPDDLAPGFGSSYGAETIAVYWQDLFTLASDRPFLHKLNIMVGGRFESVDMERVNTELFGGNVRVDTTQSNYTSQAGVVYQPDPTTSVYFGFSQSFDSINLLRTTGPNSDPAPVERGRSFEAGVKKELLQGRLTSTLNFFNTVKSDVLTPDPVDPTFRIPVGEQRSRGVELDIIGEIRPGWNIIANYAFTDAEVTNDNNIPVGDVLPNVADHAAGVWTSYEFQEGPLSGFRLGTGLTYEGERQARLPNTIQIPSYARWDALISYEMREDWKVQLNFNNITDEDIYDSQGFFIVPQAGFNVLASLTARL